MEAEAAQAAPTVNMAPLFRLMVDRRASDLFLTAGAPVKIKIEGRIHSVSRGELGAEAVAAAVSSLMTPAQQVLFREDLELDFAIAEPGLGRFRVNAFLQRGIPAMVIRYVASRTPALADLGLPEATTDLVTARRGLILVVGATGSGKSTTLAAMVDYRNEHYADHIVTIEDPIEYVHANKRAIVNQREVGLDTASFGRALRSVMRAAPDVILIGEIRDRESMQAALTLSGTGHLVLATLHANNCAETLDRILNLYPAEMHRQVMLDLSQYLRGILAQRLVPGIDGRRVAAVEVLVNTAHVAELVGKGDVLAIKEALTSSSERGVRSFDTALHDLYRAGRISLEEALSHADSRTNLDARINFG